MQEYDVPNEVYARMGPLATPGVHPNLAAPDRSAL
jgi:hypothetical protein